MLSLFVLALLLHSVSGEWFTSTSHMEALLHKEINLISTLKEYVKAEQENLKIIKKLITKLEKDSQEASKDFDNYLGHPINQYILMKRMKSAADLMNDVIIKRNLTDSMDELMIQLPKDEDVEQSARAILRLQDTYRLDTRNLAQGMVGRLHAIRSLSTDECFKIGQTSRSKRDFYHCAMWMKEAYLKSKSGDNSHERIDILDHLIYCLISQGSLRRSLVFTRELLRMNPNHDIGLIYQGYLIQTLAEGKSQENDDAIARVKHETNRHNLGYPGLAVYEELCRNGNRKISPAVQKKLSCYLWDNNRNPRLIFQPIKTEELWSSPHIVRFYDILSDNEISTLKTQAKPKMERSKVRGAGSENANYRISKTARFKDKENQLAQMITHRIRDVTGLSMTTAEDIQIGNYGIGGQYEPHFDYARKPSNGFNETLGNRIATVLFYLSDVKYGGSTVFLQPQLSVRPVKGSAVLWYNLLPNEEGDERTKHAGCPVLCGVKWIANKWIHIRTQEIEGPKCPISETDAYRLF